MPAEADDDVLGVVGQQLEEVAVVDDLEDQLLDVVGLVRVVRHERVERQLDPLGRVVGRHDAAASRGCCSGRKSKQPAHHQQRLDVVLEREVGDAATASCA